MACRFSSVASKYVTLLVVHDCYWSTPLLLVMDDVCRCCACAVHGRGLAGELMTKLTWSLVSETGGVLVSIEQISKASGQEVIKEATCELTAAQAKIVQQLVYGTLPVMYGFDLALKG